MEQVIREWLDLAGMDYGVALQYASEMLIWAKEVVGREL